MIYLRGTGSATFSDCMRYRYRLSRIWLPHKPKVCFVMLNPSTANHDILDPTVTRCKKRAQKLGYGGLEVVNIFALRSTDPKELYKVSDPVGPENFASISEALSECAIAICAWGSHGNLLNVGSIIKDCINQFFPGKSHYLKLNSDGSPAHPLYLPYSLQPVLWGEA
jgi:hypothetical protein